MTHEMIMKLGAGIIEHVGWSNGSMHNQIQIQPWYVGSMADVVLALAICTAIITCLVALVAWWVVLQALRLLALSKQPAHPPSHVKQL